MLPRGVRNNNPGNLDRTSVPWQGEDRTATARERETRFCVFLRPEFGFRAMARTLSTYQNKHGLRTVRELIKRWAPATENNTEVYVRVVARALGVSPDEPINVGKHEVMLPLLRAIAHHEQGDDHWPDAVIAAGLHLAGITA
jgi:hypothetical protein